MRINPVAIIKAKYPNNICIQLEPYFAKTTKTKRIGIHPNKNKKYLFCSGVKFI
jgi:hypothetical protein